MAEWKIKSKREREQEGEGEREREQEGEREQESHASRGEEGRLSSTSEPLSPPPLPHYYAQRNVVT